MPWHNPRPHLLAPAPPAGAQALTATDVVLRQARKLHRAARCGGISSALPAVRRVHAAQVFPGRTLSTLYRERQALQRKHFLRALAIEAGFVDWESFRPMLQQMPLDAVAHFKVVDEGCAFLNSWFSNEAQAQAHASQYGGQVFRVGTQAVVVPPEAQFGGVGAGQPAA
jgi:hypothetical protein